MLNRILTEATVWNRGMDKKRRKNKKLDLTYKASINKSTFWVLGNFEYTQVVIKAVSTYINTNI